MTPHEKEFLKYVLFTLNKRKYKWKTINDIDKSKLNPEDYLCPMKYYTGKKIITQNTYSIHHFCASWTSATAKRTLFLKRIVGVKLYDKLYGKFLHKFKWLEW